MKEAVMDAAMLNRTLAEALGWENYSAGKPWVKDEHGLMLGYFSPATSSDHLRLYVLPEIERRGLWDEFVSELASPWLQNFSAMRWEAFVLTCSPAVLAAAALEVLGGGE